MQAARGASLNTSDHTDPSPRHDRRRPYLLLFAAIAAATYALDVVTKIVAVDVLTGNPPVQVVGHYFTFYLTRNPGAAFGAGTSYTIVLSCVAVAASLAVVWTVRRLRSLGWAIGLGFLLGGILGNLTDRIFRAPGPFEGHVIDFLMFPNFPVFNFADIWINVAAAFIIAQALRGVRVDGERYEEPEKSKRKRKP